MKNWILPVGVALLLAGWGCRSVNDMMMEPALAARRGPRCTPTPTYPGADGRPTLLVVESAYDQYALSMPYEADWDIRCTQDSALRGVSRSLSLQTEVNVSEAAPGVQPDAYLQQLSQRVAQGYQAQGWIFRDSAIVRPFNIPILQYHVQSVDSAGMTFTQYNYWTLRPRQDGRVVELHIALNNPNPATVSIREGALYYYLSNFHVKGQEIQMPPVEGRPPVYR